MGQSNELVLKVNEDPLVLIHKEGKRTTAELINSTFDKLVEVSNGKKFDLIIDLIESAPLEREIRHLIKVRHQKIEPSVKSLSLCVGSNVLIKVAAQFIMPAVLKKKSVKIFTSAEQVISELITTKN